MSEPPRYHFIHAATGESSAVDDPVAWCLEHARDPLLENARERLLQCDSRTDPQRILNVVYRRCGLNMAEVRPGHLVVHHWTALADIRPFCKLHRLARPDVQVATVRHKEGLVVVQPGDGFLYGGLLGAGFPWDEYRQRWEHRHEGRADDAAASPCGRSSYRWEGVEAGRVPWAALKSIWRREQAIPCPNCDTPLAAWAFTWRHRTLLSMHGHVFRLCFACRRDFQESTGGLRPWLAATLAPGLLPACHDDGLRKTDLRPRWPAPPTPRNLYDLDNLPPDLTLDELVRILM